MYVNINHNVDRVEGGSVIDNILREYADKLEMTEGGYSKCIPCYQYLQYENVTLKQYNLLKRKIKSSKKLVGVDVDISYSDYR